MKTLKIQIRKPVTTTWINFGAILRYVQKKNAQCLNACIRTEYLHAVKREEWKVQHEKYPTKDEMPRPNVYKIATSVSPYIGSGIAAQASKTATDKIKSDFIDILLKNTKSLPTYKQTYPITIRAQDWNWHDNNLSASFLSMKASQEDLPFNRDEKEKIPLRYDFALNTKKLHPGQKNILNKIKSGAWKTGTLSIKNNRGKWFVMITYTPEKEKPVLDKNIIVGVDMGIVCAVACAVSNGENRMFLPGKQVEDYRQQIRFRRRSYQRGLRSGGKGRKYYLRKTEALSNSERNYRDTYYHMASKRVIDFAIKHNAGTIQIEDIHFINDGSLVGNWCPSDLQTKLEYKAEAAGIKVVKVNPKYTSQRCSKCGHIDRKNRKTQSEFVCSSCGHKTNADYNAACNLAVKEIDKIISATLLQLAA